MLRTSRAILTTTILLSIPFTLLTARPAIAASPTPGTGELFAVLDGGKLERMPLEHTDVRAEITGHIARVEVAQTFANPLDVKIEAVYIFPLPQDAAIDRMEIRLDYRTVRGVIMKREEARRVYREAKAAGYIAALLDQERPNIFTQSLANILPGERIEVAIRYFETLHYEADRYTFTFPMVVGPRFSPDRTAGTGAMPKDEQPSSGPDATPINPPVLEPGRRPGHDVALEVRLDAGTTIRRLDSPTHRVETRHEGDGRAIVNLAPDDTIPNKDFVLHYEVGGVEPEVVVLTHRSESDGYFLMQIQPGRIPSAPVFMPKEMIFVVDCSGSMSGEPIAQVRDAMRYALENLHPLDNFQIIRFSDKAKAFANKPVPATPAHIARGLEFIERLSGNGGTIMKGGIRKALGYPDDPQRLRIISLMTDGFIGNEKEVLAYIDEHLGEARLFPFGVGSSPNRYLIDELAFMGRGAPAYVPPSDRDGEAVHRFFERIRSPYLTHIELDWGGLQVDRLSPGRIPDLFVGQPVTVLGRYTLEGVGAVTLKARLGGQPFVRTYPVALPLREESGPAIASIWARSAIAELSRKNLVASDSRHAEAITDLALAHDLVSAYTSFVAVEDWHSTGPGVPERMNVAAPLPAGMQQDVDGEGQRDVVMQESLRVLTLAGTASAQTTASYGAAFIESLPILGRNYQDVLGMAPGVVISASSAEFSRGRGGFINVHGARDTDVVTLVDGLSVAEAIERKPSAVVRMKSIRSRFRSHEPVTILLTIENVSDQPIELPSDLSVDGGTIFLEIRDMEGRLLPGPVDLSLASEPMVLEPNDTITIPIRIDGPNGWALSRPGRYTVRFIGAPIGLPDATTEVILRKP